MLLGLRSVIYPVSDLAASVQWYRAMLGIEPYYDSPEYVGFSIGAPENGFEVGLFPGGKLDEGAIAYWGVADAAAALARLVAAGAVVHQDVHDVGGAIKMASVLDPDGTVFGIIEHPNFELTD